MADASDRILEALLQEKRQFAAPKEFAKKANVSSAAVYRKAERNPERFWAEFAKELQWDRPWKKVLEWKPPKAKWFLGGKLNIAYNCVDRHVEAGRGDKVAYYWEGEPEGDRREVTFAELQRETTKLANALRSLGVQKGTPVGIYMGMVPETPVAMLACARIGAPHTVSNGSNQVTRLRASSAQKSSGSRS